MAKKADKAEKDAQKASDEAEKKEMAARVATIADSLSITVEKGDHLSAAVRKIARVDDTKTRAVLADYLAWLRDEKSLKPKSIRTSVFDAASVLADIDQPLSKLTRTATQHYFEQMQQGLVARKSPAGEELFKRQLARFGAFVQAGSSPLKNLDAVMGYLRPKKAEKKAAESEDQAE